ncbi:MAG: HNH endonuclease [Planctomycetes bacterium]|nr:HNH endonuclease [Planctomycetota bacterium]
MSDSLPRDVKEAVASRAGHRCEYCGSPSEFCPDPLSVEHIVPRSRGGGDDYSNLALSCQGCNNFKFTSTESADPVSGMIVPLYNPRQHEWRDHFTWSADFTMLLGKSPIGRATVEKLQLNRTGVVNLRSLLRLIGNHPPDASR